LEVTNTTALKSSLSVTGDSTLTGTLGVTGTTNLTGALTGSSRATLESLEVINATVLESTLAVTGNSTLAGTLSVAGNSQINGALTATSLSGAGGSVTGLNANNVSSGTLAVARGGTGAGTLTSGKVLVGNGTGVVASPTKLHWDETNSRLGVGTATPSAPLDVIGNAEINGALSATSLSGAGGSLTGLNANNVSSGTLAVSRGGTGAGTLSSGKVLVGNGTGVVSAPSNLHWDSTNSRLGVGTATPSAPLDVIGNAEINGALSATSLSGAGGSLTGLNANNVSSGTLAVSRGGTGAGTLSSGKVLVGNGTGVVSAPSNLHWDSTNSRLGVGTATPSVPLAVVGDAEIIGTLSATSLSGAGGSVTGLNANNVSSGTLDVSRGGTGAGTLSSGKVLVGNGTGAVSAPINLHWDSTNSRLGVGTATPSAPLDVIGNAEVSGTIAASAMMIGTMDVKAAIDASAVDSSTDLVVNSVSSGHQHFRSIMFSFTGNTPGSYIQVANITTGTGEKTIWVDIMNTKSGGEFASSYVISECFRPTRATLDCLPISTTANTQDISLGVIADWTSTKLVVIRRGGSGAELTVAIKVSCRDAQVIELVGRYPTDIKTGWVADGIHGSTVMTQSGGRLGVGTRSPSCLLDIRSQGNDLARMLIGDGNEGGEVNFGNTNHGIRRSSNNLELWTSSGQVRFDTGNPQSTTTKMVINENGHVGIGTTTPGSTLHVIGNFSLADGGFFLNGWVIHRDTWDSHLFFSFGAVEDVKAYINRNNTAVQMNFTGRHRCLVTDCCDDTTCGMKGLIAVASNNDYLSMDTGLQRGIDAISMNECLPIVSLATRAKDKRVFGVIGDTEPADRGDSYGAFVTPFEKHAGDSRVYINSVGEGAIWISDELGAVDSGDFITTGTIPGYGVKQDDGALYNYTVAKVTMDCDFQNVSVRKRQLKKTGVSAYRTVMEELIVPGETTTEFRDGLYVRIVQPDTTIKIEKKSMMDIYNETGFVIATENMTLKEEYTVYENVVDCNGHAVWEDSIDADGAPIMESRYKMRWLLSDGTQISEAEYTNHKAVGESVYKAAFVGCTYHCG
jgi:hypothetical protein